MSSDGRFVTFESRNSNLVPGIINNQWNLFVRNVQSGTTALVDVTPSGTSGNAGLGTLRSAMTPDGRYVAFDSYASDLTSDPTNGFENVFVRDLQTGTTRLVSVNNSGTGGGFGYSYFPQITPDGRYVLFGSFANNLIQGTLSSRGGNLFVRDMVTNTTMLVTYNSTNTDGSNNGADEGAVITPDGRYIAFSSVATNLVNGFGDGTHDNVYVRDLVAGQTVPVSVASSGSGGGNNNSFNSSISDGGRYVVFDSTASNLVAGKTTNREDIFERDLVAQTTNLVSVNLSGVSGNADSFRTSTSSDGRYVAFESHASDLVSNDNNNTNDVFVRDMLAGTTALVSENRAGTGSANGYSYFPVFSSDSSSVAFVSYATDLVSGVTVNHGDVFVRHLTSGTTSLVSINQSGTGGGDFTSQDPLVVNANGSLIAFSSYASNLVSGVMSGLGDVFLRNLAAATTTLVSARDPSLPSITGNGGSSIQNPLKHRTDVSSDGRYVVFTTYASNLVPGDKNGTQDVFARDTWNATTALVSVNQSGTGSGNGPSYDPSISADGRYVAFTSTASDLVSGANNGTEQVFVRDLVNGTTSLVSVNRSGTGAGNGASNDAVIAANGRYVVFDSTASDLVANDNNNTVDVFERDLVGLTTALVSVNVNGTSGDAGSAGAVVTPDGRYVSFLSVANDLVFAPISNQQEVFRRDMVAGTTQMISVDNGGVPGNSFSQDQVITPDGRYVAFQSYADNLPGVTPGGGQQNVFVRDVQAGTTTLVSINSTNAGSGNRNSQDAVISDDGRYVAFDSWASNLVNGDNNTFEVDVFVRDLINGTTALISVNRSGTPSGGEFPALSADGRYVSFMSYASLVQTPTSLSNIYMRDLTAGVTTLLTPNDNSYAGEFDFTNRPMMTPDAQHVVFSSDSSSLVSNDFNQSTDVFLWSNGASVAASFVVAGYPSPATSGVSGTFTVTAKDSNGHVVTGYTGTVHFTSSDPQAILPSDYTFTNVDGGRHTFSATLETAGTQSLTATDTLTASITGTEAGILVKPASFFVSGFPSPTTAGVAHSFSVTAENGNGTTATGYTGTVHVTSTDGQALLPADYTFTGTDAGVHTFAATLKTAGSQTLTAADLALTSVTGAESGIIVNAAALSKLAVTGYPSPTVAGIAHSFTVAAQDAYGNTVTSYLGTVHFTSTDKKAVLPANYTFVVGDAGLHSFSATLKTGGTQAITGKDTIKTTITGTESGIIVDPAATNHLKVSAPASSTAGMAFSITVTALDPYGNITPNYTGTVHFTSSDKKAMLPANYTFTGTDVGVHFFTNAVTLKTAGSQTVTATDTVTATITGKTSIKVSAAAVDHLKVAAPSSSTAGTAFSITVTAQDVYNNTVTTYTGTIHFTSSDSQAILPVDYTFISTDKGVHTFSNGVTLKTAGTQTVTATDTMTATVTGSATVTVKAVLAGAVKFSATSSVISTAPTPTGPVDDWLFASDFASAIAGFQGNEQVAAFSAPLNANGLFWTNFNQDAIMDLTGGEQMN
jgi:hypothetical protein